MRTAAAALALLAAACGAPEADNAHVNAETIERLSTPEVALDDPEATVRLQPLSLDDIAVERAGEAPGAAGCRFERQGQVMLSSSGTNAIARIGGELRHFVQTTPVGPTGGFFEDRQVGISIGLASPDGTAARIAVTNRRSDLQRESVGEWLCGPVTR